MATPAVGLYRPGPREAGTMKREGKGREFQRVVKRVLPVVPVNRKVRKADFEAIHYEILVCVAEKTGADAERLARAKDAVFADLPNDLERLGQRFPSWPMLILFLYNKYLRALDTTP
jgi:hypothetical protein